MIAGLSIVLCYITFKNTCKSFWSIRCWKKKTSHAAIEEKLSLLLAETQDEHNGPGEPEPEEIDDYNAGSKFSI